jgi:hypothetical protein
MFVGSSTEARGLIQGLILNLEGRDVEVRDWATSAWALSRSTLDNIEDKLEAADFATFILSPDDVAIIREKEQRVARDNVLFELGMSFGHIGRDRTFILVPKAAMHTASDLDGITVVVYEPELDSRKAMKIPALKIMEAIESRGHKDRAGLNGARRGSTTSIDVVADGALEVFESRNEYFGDLRLAVQGGDKVPAKFQFAAADGGRYWLRLCRGNSYGYFKRAKELLKANAARLAEEVRTAVDTTAIDLVSLGSGDGSKDDIILHALADKLKAPEVLYYYPVDISDILLAEAVRYVSRHGLSKERYRCKAVLGDFTNVKMLKEIVDFRPNPNLFSVLGNVIGSFEESEIFAGIAGAMEAGDLVLIEANIGEPGNSIATLEDNAASQWDLSTLAALDIPPDSYEIVQEEKTNQSDVANTRTMVSYAVSRGASDTKYTLSGMHHYSFDELKQHVTKDLGVELIDEISGDGVCLLLGQRPG